MTDSIEIINGQRYLVTRDDRGVIVRMSAMDSPTAISKRRTVTRFAFRMLFTADERMAIDDIFDAAGVEVGRRRIRTFMADLQSLVDVDLDHPWLVAGVRLLEQRGIIAVGRADQILAGIPPA